MAAPISSCMRMNVKTFSRLLYKCQNQSATGICYTHYQRHILQYPINRTFNIDLNNHALLCTRTFVTSCQNLVRHSSIRLKNEEERKAAASILQSNMNIGPQTEQPIEEEHEKPEEKKKSFPPFGLSKTKFGVIVAVFVGGILLMVVLKYGRWIISFCYK